MKFDKEHLDIGMADSRKDELINNFITWMIEHHSNDEDLYRVLHKHIGLTKEELHKFDVETLDEYFKAEKDQREEITDLITGEDLAQQAIYAANAPEGLSASEKASAMLGMLGADITDDSVYDKPQKDLPKTFVVRGVTGTLVELTPEVVLYNSIDYMGKPQFNLGIRLYCKDSGSLEPYANLTVNFHEFIGMKNCAYIDTNNCPFANEILKTGIARDMGVTKQSGYCTYPLWEFDKKFLQQIGGETYQLYSDKYDENMEKAFADDDDMDESDESEDEDFSDEPCLGM